MTDSKKEPRKITLPHHDYQPSMAELEETFDMPAANTETIRDAFFSPVIIQRIKTEDK